MISKERKTVVFTILGKTLLYIVAIAITFAIIILAWEKYDWLPFVKNMIRGLIIPILLGGFLVFLLRHEISVVKDKWKQFFWIVIFLTGTLVFINAGIIAQEACAKVMKIDSITTLSDEEIMRADYLQIENIEPDTISYNYLFDDAIIHARRSFTRKINFFLYQVCPLKDKKGVFLCTRTKETHSFSYSSKNKLQQRRTDFINREKGSIKRVAPTAHFFKVIHQSDNFEQYQASAVTCTTRHGAISPDHLILLEICQPDTIKVWADNVLYIFFTLLVGFSVLAIKLMGKGVFQHIVCLSIFFHYFV